MSPRRRVPAADLVARYAPQLMSIGEVIVRRRQALDLTQEQLAERCDFSKSFVAEVERGRRNPSFISLLRFAEALGCTVEDLAHDARI